MHCTSSCIIVGLSDYHALQSYQSTTHRVMHISRQEYIQSRLEQNVLVLLAYSPHWDKNQVFFVHKTPNIEFCPSVVTLKKFKIPGLVLVLNLLLFEDEMMRIGPNFWVFDKFGYTLSIITNCVKNKSLKKNNCNKRNENAQD